MKTSSSFFPTRTDIKSREHHRQHKAQLIKPKQRASTTPKLQTEPVNIFKDKSNPAYKQQAENPQFRPIGGQNWFKKMLQHSKQHPIEFKKTSKRSYKDNTLRNIAITSGSRFRRDKYDREQGQETLPLKSISENQRGKVKKEPVVMVDQMFLSHASYEPSGSTSKLRSGTGNVRTSIAQSQTKSRPKTSKITTTVNRMASQCQEYHDKVALLNQINYSKPLVERYGQHYFEYLLRNRYEDDLKPPPYVYLLSQKKFGQTKTISKIRNQRPEIRERQMMILKGRKMTSQADDI